MREGAGVSLLFDRFADRFYDQTINLLLFHNISGKMG